MLSIWEKNHWTEFDLIVIGGGIVGLSTAISWKENHPLDEVLVVERGTLPTGASTRNAGFACFGSLTELLVDIKLLGEEGCVQLVERRCKGLQKLRNRLGDKNIDLQVNGGYELLRKTELPAIDQIDFVNDVLKELFEEPVYRDATGRISSFGFNINEISGMLYNPYEGQLDSGLMMKNLVKLARQLDIEIRTGCKVEKINTGERIISVKDDLRNEYFLKGNKIAICTNAFAKELLPQLHISPGRGIVLVTKPLNNVPFKGTFHYDEGYYYFRDFGDRVIFGGGRNLSPEEETTTSLSVNERILNHLVSELHHTLMPGQKPEVEMSWAGIMAFGESKKPIIEKITAGVGVAVRLGGMGVAIGSLAGDELAQLLAADED